MSKEFNFKNDLEIDLNNLHDEWRTHAQTRYKYACETSYLDKVVKKTNEGLAVIKAKLIKECKEKNAKITVQQIDAFCVEHPDYIEAREEQIDAEYELNMIKNALRAFDDRKSALENEVKLWISDYFSSPVEKMQSDQSKMVSVKNSDESSNKIRSNINKKRIRK
jgi:hypothetical protein